MLGMDFELYGCVLLISAVIAEPLAPQPTVFDKFHQNDFKLKFEHMDVDHYDKNVAKELKIVTFKYNRTWTSCNITFDLKIDLNNELEVIIQTYKFASNEYRMFRLRLQVNACFAISKNLVEVGDLRKCGNFVACPLKKERPIHICNWTTDESKYPPFLPTGRYMVDIQFMYRSTEIGLAKSYAEVYRLIPIPA